MIKKILITAMLALVLTFGACSATETSLNTGTSGIIDTTNTGTTTQTTTTSDGGTSEITEAVYVPVSVTYDTEDMSTTWDKSSAITISLNGDTISTSSNMVSVEKNAATVLFSGTYVITGTLNDGQIIVNAQNPGTVRLVLDNADITCSDSAPVFVESADKVIVTLADGSSNSITDGDSYTYTDPEQDEPNAALFSKSDLTINGGGSLTVNANYNNGIQSKDGLIITGGDITVNSVNDGIKGKDYIAMNDGTVTINAGADGMQSTNDSDQEKGYIAIDGGKLTITAANDGIQAETNILVTGGAISVTSGGGSKNVSTSSTWGNWGNPGSTTTKTSTNSAKGLKAKINVTVTGGTINIDSSDDSINTNDSVVIESGTLIMASGDDGIHANSTITINGGSIDLSKSYEGIESTTITINDGIILLVSGDDGINGVGGSDGSSVNGRPGQNMFAESSGASLYINGGYVYVDADGDGIDINGSIEMTDGTVIVNGPVENMNGALDFSTFKITGGFLVAAGSSGMAEAPGDTSTLNSVMANFTTQLQAGTIFRIEDTSGNSIITFKPSKIYQSVVVSSPDLVKGEDYLIYSGGTIDGTQNDGLYTSGTYTDGTQVASFTLSDTLTVFGSYGMGGGGFPGGMR